MDFATAIETHTSSQARRLATIRRIPWLPMVQALAVTMMCSLAAESNAAVVQGTVVNKTTNRFLERATVQVVGTRLRALTDKEGNFRIAGVPAGTFTVTADYTGLDLGIMTITVAQEETVRADFELTSSAVYLTEEVTVSSTLEGNAFAINQQRKAESARTVVSVDAFVDNSTGSPGEFLKSVQGVQMDYSQNEPQTPRVRGFDPTLSTVTMDGNRSPPQRRAAPTAACRSTSCPSPASAPWRSSRPRSRRCRPTPSAGPSTFRARARSRPRGRRISLQAGTNVDGHSYFGQFDGPGHGEKSEQRGVYPIGRIEYANAFLDNRLGLFASVGHEKTNQLGSSVTHNLNVTDGPAVPPDGSG